MAREMLLTALFEDDKGNPHPAKAEMLTRVFKLYRVGLKGFEKSLALRFNMIRAALHFGGDAEVAEALKLAVETLKKPVAWWEVDAMDDVLPLDFLPATFNSRTYFDEIVKHLAYGKPRTQRMAELLLAAIYHLTGLYSRNPDLLLEAVALDPEFPFYRLYAAGQLIARNQGDDMDRAEKLLVELTEDSMLFVEASELLEQLQAKGLFADRDYGESVRMAQFARSRGFTNTEWIAEALRPAGDPPCAAPGAPAIAPAPSRFKRDVELVLTPSAPGCETPLLTAILWGDDADALLETVRGLTRQSIAPRMEIFAIRRDGGQDDADLLKRYGGSFQKTHCVRSDPGTPLFAEVNRCVEQACGGYVTFVPLGSRRRSTQMSLMIEELERRPEASLAYCNAEYFAQAHSESAPRKYGVLRRGAFDRRSLFAADPVGDDAIWRRDLHAVYGLFAPDFHEAAPYEFLLRVARSERFLCVDDGDATVGHVSPAPKPPVSPPDALMERARAANWPEAWGTRPAAQPVALMPPTLADDDWTHELHTAFFLQLVDAPDFNVIRGMFQLAQDVVKSGETAIAEAVLADLRARYPFMQHAGLMHGDLLNWLGRPAEARARYEEGLGGGCYKKKLEACLRAGAAGVEEEN